MVCPLETNAPIDQLQVRMRDRRVQNVFIDVIAWARMHHEHFVLDMAVGQSTQPPQSLRADDVDGPADNRGRVLVEPLEYLGIRACAVMVDDQSQPTAESC